MTEAIVIVRFDENGDLHYDVIGDERVRLFIVDDRAPNDRVYEWLQRSPAERFREIVPAGSEIGSSADERHAAIEAVVNARYDGRKYLSVVE